VTIGSPRLHHAFRVASASLVFLASSVATSAQDAPEWSGRLSVEVRGFLVAPDESGQPRMLVSPWLQPEYYRAWRTQSLLVVPFVRFDPSDPERTHGDIRELLWRMVHDTWELRAGIGKMFWGVTESQHLVDIINQTDVVENGDGEDKLGQPMVSVSLIRRWGHLDLFVLPGFRERTFPGEKGRLRFPLRVARELTQYTSSAGTVHVDGAVRWSHVLGGWDLGLSHFRGTGREPQLLFGTTNEGESVLIPRYVVINQTALDVQTTTGGWLWKLELISRGGQGDRFAGGKRFNALTGGFEYTFANVRGSGRDVGVLAEYLFDDRGRLATTPFEDDMFVGARLELNDVQTTRLLAGAIVDRRTGATFVSLESGRRLGNRWTMNLETRLFLGLQGDDYLFGFRNDDYAQLELSWFF